MAGIKRSRSSVSKRSRTGRPRTKMRRTQSVAIRSGDSIARDQILTRSIKSTMRYKVTKQITLLGSSDGTGYLVLRGNSIFDPEFILGGGTPRGFTQISALYGEYQVVGCTIEARFQNQGTTTRPYGFIAIRNTGTAILTTKDVLEGPDRVYTKVPMAKAASVGDGSESAFLSMAVNPIVWNGYKVGSDNSETKAAVTANPIEGCFVYVGGGDPSNTNSGLMSVTVLLTYEVKFTEPKNPA